MRERLALLDGDLVIETNPGAWHDARRRGARGMKIRVLIVDDHPVVRSGLKSLLEAEEDIEPVGEAGTMQEAVFRSRSLKPDVILMDVVMPGGSGIEATPAVLKEAPDAKVLILSMQDDPSYVRESFAAGASGYVLKEAADEEVVTAVREVAGGGHYVHPSLGAKMVAADAEERRRAESDPLTDREREVLRLLALGHTNQEIAQDALPVRAHGRDAPSAHHAEAPTPDPRRARAVCDGAGDAR